MTVAFNLLKPKVNIKTVEQDCIWAYLVAVSERCATLGDSVLTIQGRTSWAVLGAGEPLVPLRGSLPLASPRWRRKRSCPAGGLWLSCGRCGACGGELGWKVAGFGPTWWFPSFKHVAAGLRASFSTV